MSPIAKRGPARPQDPVQHLTLERRSYIIGTLLVWAIILTTVLILLYSMAPQLWAQPQGGNWHAVMQQRLNTVQLTWEQKLLLEILVLVGAVALFFLNWRFSFLLQRPRWAFAPGASSVSGRWFWWILLALNSMFYISLLVPQLITTAILAAWGKQELNRLSGRPHGSDQ